jgi:hypothetical protein
MRVACVAGVLVVSATIANADPPAASRRLESVQLGWVHELSDEEVGDAGMLSIEAGKLYAPGLGVAGLLRYGKYAYGDDYDNDRHDILVGPRIYVEPVPDRLLLALGAGVLISLGEVIDHPPQGQPFVEAYAGVLVLRMEQTELEVGLLGGLALDEELRWLGVSFGLRRRAW